MKHWTLADSASEAEKATFDNLDRIFALEGDLIGKGPQSDVIRVVIESHRYYVKRYRQSKGLRRYIGYPRVQTEWQNLNQFAQWGIPTTPLVAWGLERDGRRFVRGSLITSELIGTTDMASMARQGDERLKDRHWVENISRKLADITQTLHRHGFAHNDLHWRNLLVNQKQELFLIDCPSGRFWWGPFLRYRIVKDLACLDKMAKRHLSRSQRLRFYLQYRGTERLTRRDKRVIRKVLQFFRGRE